MSYKQSQLLNGFVALMAFIMVTFYSVRFQVPEMLVSIAWLLTSLNLILVRQAMYIVTCHNEYLSAKLDYHLNEKG